MIVIIGIDPGITGAIAAINERGRVWLHDTPTTIIKINKKLKSDYLTAEMAAILEEYKNRYECKLFIEKVNAMPNFRKSIDGEEKQHSMGATSAFNFGTGYGYWIGIAAAFKIPITKVTPQTWKKTIMQSQGDKDMARIRAQELFPQAISQLNLKKHIGRADALLIAEYGRRIVNIK